MVLSPGWCPLHKGGRRCFVRADSEFNGTLRDSFISVCLLLLHFNYGWGFLLIHSEVRNLKVAGLTEDLVMRVTQWDKVLLLLPTSVLQDPQCCLPLDSAFVLHILFCLILRLVITPLMNITVLLSHLLKKYS